MTQPGMTFVAVREGEIIDADLVLELLKARLRDCLNVSFYGIAAGKAYLYCSVRDGEMEDHHRELVR